MEVDVFERLEINILALALQVDHLAAHQPRSTGGQAQLPHHLQQLLGRHAGAAQRHHFKGAGEQGIARQDRVGLAVHLVIGGPAAAQIVVVHGGQIVMDQRHGVNHLQRHRRGHRQFAVAAGQLTGRQAEDRPQALAARQQRIAHRLAQALGALRPQRPVERSLHLQTRLFEIGSEVEAGGLFRCGAVVTRDGRGHGGWALGHRCAGFSQARALSAAGAWITATDQREADPARSADTNSPRCSPTAG